MTLHGIAGHVTIDHDTAYHITKYHDIMVMTINSCITIITAYHDTVCHSDPFASFVNLAYRLGDFASHWNTQTTEWNTRFCVHATAWGARENETPDRL